MVIFGTYISLAVFWLAVAVIFLIIEAVTVGLTTIWFAAGAFVALILSMFHVPVIAQFIVFLIVSFCLLLCGKAQDRQGTHQCGGPHRRNGTGHSTDQAA